MSKQWKRNYQSLLQQINIILTTVDPLHLMSDDAPNDEYTYEAEKILARIYSQRDKDKIKEAIFVVFLESFEARIAPDCLEDLSNQLAGVLEIEDKSKPLCRSTGYNHKKQIHTGNSIKKHGTLRSHRSRR